MARIIAILNDKGGVAKTTTTANLGTALWLLGKKVLMVDTDQQCNLTQMLDQKSMLPDEDGYHTLYEWLRDRNNIPINERYDGLDFVPSSRQMANATQELTGVAGHEMLLSRRLSLVSNDYDYILIDCVPGGKSLMNINTLVACDSVIIPTEASVFSIKGAPNLLSFINEVSENYEKNIQILGYLLVKFNPRTSLGREVKDFYRDSPTLGGPLIPVQIRSCQRCNECAAEEMSLFEYAPDSTAAEDYMHLAEWLTGIPRRKGWIPRVWGERSKLAFQNRI